MRRISPHFALYALSDSFMELWPALAASVGAEIRIANHVDPTREAGALARLVCTAGIEAQTLRFLSQEPSILETVVIGTAIPPRLVAEIFKGGAADYIALPDDLSALRSALAERVEAHQRRQNSTELEDTQRELFDFSNIIGRSPGLVKAIERAAKLIPQSQPTVLLTGETGTGKGLFAQAIHYNGPRAAQPFVEVNCAAMPPTLLEAELFGYEAGAFTDARTAKAGLFEVADQGTLFLDEIGEVPLAVQVKLLKAIEDKRVRRLGATRETSVDVRIISATSRDLMTEVRGGAFRSDLYYRLCIVPIHIPPLRDRGDDALLLLDHFVERFAREYNVRNVVIPQSVKRAILGYPWPGNVRELKNAAERGVLLGGGALKIDEMLPASNAPADHEHQYALPFPATLAELERAAARAMVELCGGNKSAAAEALQISRKKLYALLHTNGAG